jgi:hypothetical protein
VGVGTVAGPLAPSPSWKTVSSPQHQSAPPGFVAQGELVLDPRKRERPQIPPTHATPLGQETLHDPQWFGSLVGSTQEPLHVVRHATDPSPGGASAVASEPASVEPSDDASFEPPVDESGTPPEEASGEASGASVDASGPRQLVAAIRRRSRTRRTLLHSLQPQRCSGEKVAHLCLIW